MVDARAAEQLHLDTLRRVNHAAALKTHLRTHSWTSCRPRCNGSIGVAPIVTWGGLAPQYFLWKLRFININWQYPTIIYYSFVIGPQFNFTRFGSPLQFNFTLYACERQKLDRSWTRLKGENLKLKLKRCELCYLCCWPRFIQ